MRFNTADGASTLEMLVDMATHVDASRHARVCEYVRTEIGDRYNLRARPESDAAFDDPPPPDHTLRVVFVGKLVDIEFFLQVRTPDQVLEILNSRYANGVVTDVLREGLQRFGIGFAHALCLDALAFRIAAARPYRAVRFNLLA